MDNFKLQGIKEQVNYYFLYKILSMQFNKPVAGYTGLNMGVSMFAERWRKFIKYKQIRGFSYTKCTSILINANKIKTH